MFTRFTERARKVIVMSRNEAGRLKSDSLDCEHVVLGLLTEGGGVAVAVGEAKGRDADSPQYCDACFSGEYPVAPSDQIEKGFALKAAE